MIAQHVLLDHVARFHPDEAIGKRDPRAGDRCGARAAVGLDDVAVDGDLPLAERRQIDHRAQERPISRWISTVRPPCLPALASRRVRSDVARGQHAVFRGDPAAPLALEPGRQPLFELAVTRTWVSPNFTRQEPSAYLTTPRSRDTGRSSSACRRLGRIGVLPRDFG